MISVSRDVRISTAARDMPYAAHRIPLLPTGQANGQAGLSGGNGQALFGSLCRISPEHRDVVDEFHHGGAFCWERADEVVLHVVHEQRARIGSILQETCDRGRAVRSGIGYEPMAGKPMGDVPSPETRAPMGPTAKMTLA
ncbi:hypothetical protein [Streptomyces sp. NPDC058308]|uniref:hypothetical protein n=1 Tax=Streptomyces sp. NPDC058308 TaxID=3346440 RepID=UPI0036EB8CA2